MLFTWFARANYAARFFACWRWWRFGVFINDFTATQYRLVRSPQAIWRALFMIFPNRIQFIHRTGLCGYCFARAICHGNVIEIFFNFKHRKIAAVIWCWHIDELLWILFVQWIDVVFSASFGRCQQRQILWPLNIERLQWNVRLWNINWNGFA